MQFSRKTAWKPPFIGADYLGVFALVVFLYAVLNWSPSFLDPDSFYHVKISQLMALDGVVRDFPWLPFTTLAHDYADHHFLYHVLLIPFLSFFSPMVGAKVATVTLGAAALTAFYGALKAYRVRLPLAFTLLLATSGAFMLRMNLTKTSAISVTVLMLALIAVRKNKPLLLFFLSWVYVWLYGGWPIIAMVVGAFLAARAIADRISERHPLHSWGHIWFWKRLLGLRRNAIADFFAVREVRLAIGVASGLLCGLIINPYFPANFAFYWEQIVQIAVINYKDTIGVGAEWYPYTWTSFFNESSGLLMAIAAVIALSLAMALWPQLSMRSARPSREALIHMAAPAVLATIFLLLVLRSRRHIEYFAPFAAIAMAQAFTYLMERLDSRGLGERLNDILPRAWQSRFVRMEVIAGLYVAMVLLFTGGRDLYRYGQVFRQGIPWNRYERVAAWMRENVTPGAVVLHSDWDQFPVLFLHDDMHRYIIGLDPTFLYRQDRERYWAWVQMSTGKFTGDVSAEAARLFGARYFFVGANYQAMRAMLERDADIVKVYHDDETDVYVTR